MHSELRISTIIPTLNEAERIEHNLQRILELEADEILVVDGGSSDGTPDRVRAAGVEVLTGARGRASQQNIGANRARGDVFLFLHADCWLSADGMRQLRIALADDSVLCGAFRQRITAEGVAYRLLEFGNALRASWLGLPFGDQAIFVRRSLFEQVGGFPQVRLMEDVLLMKRLRKLTRPTILPGPLHVDARRWQRYGVIRQTARNWFLLGAVALGIHPDRLARFYPQPTVVRESENT